MFKNDLLSGKKIAVLGAGISGRSLAHLAVKLGAEVFVSDSSSVRPEIADEFKKLGVSWESEGNTEKIFEADEIVISSGISLDAPVLAEAKKRAVRLTGELDFVFPYLSGRIIAVTGSNGKTTTVSMTGFLLEKSGYRCHTGGNIGNAAANAACKDFDFIVLELSSFQLARAESFKCDVAVVTNLAPDHIDWHGSYENYVDAKANVIRCLSSRGAAIYQKRDELALCVRADRKFPLSWQEDEISDSGILIDENRGAAYLIDKGQEKHLFKFHDLRLLGRHNLENCAMSVASLALSDVDVNGLPIAEYKAPGHRCAFAGEADGVTFVDDSKGTNVAASVAAMSSLPGEKVVILGGKGKGEEYAPLAEAVKKYAVWAVLIGSEKEKIAAALDFAGYTSYSKADDMVTAVKEAHDRAAPGQTVLLSPACTSWDMYPNFEARGDHFVSVVKEIIGDGD